MPIADPRMAIIDGIEKDRLHIYVGRDSQLMGAAVRLAPKRATHLISKQMKQLMDRPQEPA